MLQEKEDPSVSFLEGVTKYLWETKCAADIEGQAIQRLPKMGIHAI